MIRFFVALVILALALLIGKSVVRPRVVDAPPVPRTLPAQTARASRPDPRGTIDAESAAAVVAVVPKGAADEAPSPSCPVGMVLIDGQPCGGWERRCIDRLDGSADCREYSAEARCRALGPPVRFCMDRYEYPNVPGMLPAILVTAEQARRACRREGKRLCREREWTFACEGPHGLPFGYGLRSSDEACNVGASTARIAVRDFWNAMRVSELVTTYDRRAPSGAQPGCLSAFGVSDLIGNAAEWVESNGTGAYASALKGGDFLASTAECRPVLKLAATNYRAFPVGFRCCSDALDPGEPSTKGE